MFCKGETVEVYDEYEKKWVPALIELRYGKADEDGRRSYEYGVELTNEIGVHMLIDEAKYVRVPTFLQSPNVVVIAKKKNPARRPLRENKVKRGN